MNQFYNLLINDRNLTKKKSYHHIISKIIHCQFIIWKYYNINKTNIDISVLLLFF